MRIDTLELSKQLPTPPRPPISTRFGRALFWWTDTVPTLRDGLIRDYQRAGVEPTADDAFNFSMSRGYLSEPYHSEALEWCRAAGAEIAYIHTSGHASPADLRPFAISVRPKMVVPVHCVKWDEESHGFGVVRRLADAEAMVIP